MVTYSKEKLENIKLGFSSELEYIDFLLSLSIKKIKNLIDEKSKYKKFIIFDNHLNVLTISYYVHLKLLHSFNVDCCILMGNIVENLSYFKICLEYFLQDKLIPLKGTKEFNFLIPKELEIFGKKLETFINLIPSLYINTHYNLSFSYNNVNLDLNERNFVISKLNFKNNELESNDKLKIMHFIEFFGLRGVVIRGNVFRSINLNNKNFLISLGKNELLLENEIKILNMERIEKKALKNEKKY